MRAAVRTLSDRRHSMSFQAPDVSAQPLAQLVSLKGKRAVVTGAARGLGYAIARRLAEAGADVALGDRDETGAARAAEAIEKDFLRRASGGPLDVASSASVASFAERAVNMLGG